MAYTRFVDDLKIIQKLGDQPNELDGLSADELKEKFDAGGLKIQTFLNNVLLPELEAELTAITNRVVPTSNGGTGLSSVTAGNFLVGNGTTAMLEKTPAEVLELIGAAPNAYGLGSYGVASNIQIVNDCNDACSNGWYGVAESTENGPGYEGVMRVDAHNYYAHVCQTIYTGSDSGLYMLVLQRTMLSGTWGDWKYVNPPCVAGVEYRTTELIQGRPVYTKMVGIGSLPSNSTKAVDHGLDIFEPVRCTGFTYNSGLTAGIRALPYEYNGQSAILSLTATQILISTNFTANSEIGVMQIWYTKKS